jgi:PAS domain S-box-containing protein
MKKQRTVLAPTNDYSTTHMPTSSSPAAMLRITLSSISDAVITTDIKGLITFLNPVAQSLTGWTQTDAVGLPLEKIFKIINEESRDTVENPATRALREGKVGVSTGSDGRGQPGGIGVDRGINTSSDRSDGRADTGRETALGAL